MEANNPYQAPSADVSDLPEADAYDQTSPFSPAGRFGRLSYLAWGALTGFLSSIIGGMVVVAFMAATNSPTVGMGGQLFVTVLVILSVFVFAMRRLHDTGASGGWAVLFVIPLLNLLLGLYLVLKKGDEQANRFAPPRETRTWEKVVGGLVVGLMVLGLISVIAALVLPAIAPR